MSPMAIIWPCGLSVEQYAAAGRGVTVPRPSCPVCEAPMMFWSGYARRVRQATVVFSIWVRRCRCGRCGGPSHALLPSFCLLGRLDAVEVIGPAIVAVSAGGGCRPVARGIGELFAYTTVRGWWRRHRERIGWLWAALRVSQAGPEGWAGLGSMTWGVGPWPAVSLWSGGAWLSTTTTTPTTTGSGGQMMTVMVCGIPP